MITRRRVAWLALALLAVGCNQILGNEAAQGLLADGGGASDAGGVDARADVALVDGGCPDGRTACDGTCVDTTNDPAHCGACNHVCESCKAGTCQPVRLADGLDPTVGLALDAEGVYALTTPAPATSGKLWRGDLTPGATMTAALTALDRPSALTLDATMVGRIDFAVSNGAGGSAVMQVVLPAAPAELAGLKGNLVGDLDFGDGKIWGTDLKGGRVWHAAPDGSAFAASNAAVAGLTLGNIDVSAGVLMVAMRSTPCVQAGQVLRWDGSSTPTPIGDTIPCPTRVAFSGGDLLVANREPAPAGSIVRIDAGGTTTALFSGEDNPTAIDVDSGEIFWADEGAGASATGSINRSTSGSSTRTTVVSGRARPVAIAVDATHIYWAERGLAGGTGAVYRIER